MSEIQTIWNARHPYRYNPPQWASKPPPKPPKPPKVPKPKAKRVRPPAPPPEDAFDPQHHLIYAAMIDGCIGQGQLATRLGLLHKDVKNAQKVLAKRGYIRMGYWNHHKAYVPVEIDA